MPDSNATSKRLRVWLALRLLPKDYDIVRPLTEAEERELLLPALDEDFE